MFAARCRRVDGECSVACELVDDPDAERAAPAVNCTTLASGMRDAGPAPATFVHPCPACARSFVGVPIALPPSLPLPTSNTPLLLRRISHRPFACANAPPAAGLPSPSPA